jgi:hypothetical protein
MGDSPSQSSLACIHPWYIKAGANSGSSARNPFFGPLLPPTTLIGVKISFRTADFSEKVEWWEEGEGEKQGTNTQLVGRGMEDPALPLDLRGT